MSSNPGLWYGQPLRQAQPAQIAVDTGEMGNAIRTAVEDGNRPLRELLDSLHKLVSDFQDSTIARMLGLESNQDEQKREFAKSNDSWCAQFSALRESLDLQPTEEREMGAKAVKPVQPEGSAMATGRDPPNRPVAPKDARFTAFVVNFPRDFSSDALWELLQPWGANYLHRRQNNGYAFADFNSEEDLARAIANCNGFRFSNGHKGGIRVERARDKTMRQQREAPPKAATLAKPAVLREAARGDHEQRPPTTSADVKEPEVPPSHQQQCERWAAQLFRHDPNMSVLALKKAVNTNATLEGSTLLTRKAKQCVQSSYQALKSRAEAVENARKPQPKSATRQQEAQASSPSQPTKPAAAKIRSETPQSQRAASGAEQAQAPSPRQVEEYDAEADAEFQHGFQARLAGAATQNPTHSPDDGAAAAPDTPTGADRQQWVVTSPTDLQAGPNDTTQTSPASAAGKIDFTIVVHHADGQLSQHPASADDGQQALQYFTGWQHANSLTDKELVIVDQQGSRWPVASRSSLNTANIHAGTDDEASGGERFVIVPGGEVHIFVVHHQKVLTNAASKSAKGLYGGLATGAHAGAQLEGLAPCEEVHKAIRDNAILRQGEWKPYPKGFERWLEQQGLAQSLFNPEGDGNCLLRAMHEAYNNHVGNPWPATIQGLRNQTADKLLSLSASLKDYPIFFQALDNDAAVKALAASIRTMGRASCETVFRLIALTMNVNIETRDSHTAQVLGLYAATLGPDGCSELTEGVPTVQLCLLRGGTHVYYNQDFEEVRVSKGAAELEAERQSTIASGASEKDIVSTVLKMADGHVFLVVDNQGNDCMQGSTRAPDADLQ